jgi:hypothetical protein
MPQHYPSGTARAGGGRYLARQMGVKGDGLDGRTRTRAAGGRVRRPALLGFDRTTNLLEIVYNVIDERAIKVFHAMKCRNSYYTMLRRK